MTQDIATPRKTKKFLFDAHNFDAGHGDEEPPPPVFTEAELAAARQSAYAQGSHDGMTQAHASFEKQTADLLAAIQDHFSMLFDAEDRRARVFEKESIQLAYTIFAKAFPALNDRFGLGEVKSVIAKVLETVHEQPEIIIEVPADYEDIIRQHIAALMPQSGGPRCIVRVAALLGPGQCRMIWANGQAMRNGPHLAEQIRIQIEQVLADKAALADNGQMTAVSSDAMSTAPSSAPDSTPERTSES